MPPNPDAVKAIDRLYVVALVVVGIAIVLFGYAMLVPQVTPLESCPPGSLPGCL